ncbi:MAG: cysteine--tRNA ligase [Betaproteobacteria bacterium]|nr:cysteine--tRNA ligase [Betaproteobacteria bacterium]
MTLTLYDNFERRLREFRPLSGNEVGLYTCGPTVYDFQHIGNLRTYLFEDCLKRVLAFNGYRVRHVMNITDVGHLTSDADTGEDKMEKGSRRTGRSAWDIAEEYTQVFREDLAAMNIAEPDVWCKATDHIAEQIAFIEDLERKGFTYRTSDGVYFDTSRQPDYGYLARLDRAGLEAGKRVELGEKRSLTDFALWKFSAPGEQRQMEWASPWGTGFPGWHIECSAMAQKYLGDYFDIHCGGEDHIPVHHTNEIAQTEARVGTRLANFWMHGYFLTLNNAKMAKSAGEFLRMKSLTDRGYDPLTYRFLCLTAHYRTQMSFSWDAMDAAQTGLERLRRQVFELGPAGAADPAFVDRFRAEVNDDLQFPKALALLWEALKSPLPDPAKKATLLAFDACLGLRLAEWQPTVDIIPPEVEALARARLAARQAKNWAESDRLRDAIAALGFAVEDSAGTYKLVKKTSA